MSAGLRERSGPWCKPSNRIGAMWKFLLICLAVDIPAYLIDHRWGAFVIVGSVLLAFIVGVFRSTD